MEIIVILFFVFCYFGFLILISFYATNEANKVPTKNKKSLFKDCYDIFDDSKNLLGRIIYNRNDLNYFRSCKVYDASEKEIFSASGKRELFEGKFKSRMQIDFFLYQNNNIVGSTFNVKIRNNFDPDFFEIKTKCELNQNKIFIAMILLLNLKY